MWRFEVFKGQDGQWRWRLTLRNTLIVFESTEVFRRRADAEKAAVLARSEIGNSLIEAV